MLKEQNGEGCFIDKKMSSMIVDRLAYPLVLNHRVYHQHDTDCCI
jgi:hypothetical protein